MNETLIITPTLNFFSNKIQLINNSIDNKQDYNDYIVTSFGSNLIENHILDSNWNYNNNATYGYGMSMIYGSIGTMTSSSNPTNYTTDMNRGVYFNWIAEGSNIWSVQNVAKPKTITLKCRYGNYGSSQVYLEGWGLKFIGEQTGTIFIPFTMIDVVGTPSYWKTQGTIHLYNNITQYTDWSGKAVNGFMRYDDTFVMGNMDKMFTTNDDSFTLAFVCANSYSNANLYIEQLDIEF